MSSLWSVLEAGESGLAGGVQDLRGRLEQVEEVLRRRVIAREVYRGLLGGGAGVIECEDTDAAGEDAGVGTELGERMAAWGEPMRALVKVFEQADGSALRCAEVCERLGLAPDHSQVEVVRHRCRRLLERGVPASAGRGLYRYVPVAGVR